DQGKMSTARKFIGAFLLLSSPFLFCLSLRAQGYPLSEAQRQAFLQRLSDAAIERTHHVVRYDSAYVRIPYPGGDVPSGTGVCTDEVIRSYRALGIDLQKEVHEDMQANFSAYPNHLRWMLLHTDTSIDHRRVPNLMVFFGRKGEQLAITKNGSDYNPGDLVTWDLGGNVPHIGIVVDKKSTSGRYLIVHNIGQGPKAEDVLFNWKITGHYRYFGSQPFRFKPQLGACHSEPIRRGWEENLNLPKIGCFSLHSSA
ncbi:MAG: DUF1287 domain-containing protein, partial [Candidatus Acidiferrum sp.]